MRGGRGGHSPTRVSLASFSLHRAKRTKSRQRNLRHNLSLCQNNFVKFLRYACFFDCPEQGKKNWNALRPRGPFLFRSAGKGSKRGRFARHCGSRKIQPRTSPFGEPSQTQRLTAFQTHGKVRFCPCRARQGQKSPHEPRRKILRALPRPTESCLTRSQRRATQGFCNPS